MVENPKDYRWSSYATNAIGLSSSLQTPHPSYLALGDSVSLRLDRYRDLFAHQLDAEVLKDIRLTTQKGLVLGTEAFQSQMADLLDR